ncbi:MAG: gliding motility-associated C-terminal domain-containing protein [Prevotellaceae bacterium]|jgi:PKD repeat protein|nr:gliding motility-associated C-terminal domain-containing protein [Prevotellaceae bacterium]
MKKKNIIRFLTVAILSLFFCGNAVAEISGAVFGDTILCESDTVVQLEIYYTDNEDLVVLSIVYLYVDDTIGDTIHLYTYDPSDAIFTAKAQLYWGSRVMKTVTIRVDNMVNGDSLVREIPIQVIQPAVFPTIIYPNSVCEYEMVSIVQPPVYGITFEYVDAADPAHITVADTFHILVKDTTGCAIGNDTWLIPVPVEHLPSPNFAPTTPVVGCSEASIVQTPESDMSYLYFEADKSTPLANPAAITVSGTYYICKINTVSGCHSDTLPVTVVINTPPTFTPANPAPVCAPNTASIVQAFDADFVYKYYQSDKTTAVANPAAVGAGTYYITKIETATSCVSEFMPVTVTVNPKPVFTPVVPAAVCSPNTVSIEQAYEYGYIFNYYTNATGTIPLVDYTAIATTGTRYITKTDETTGCVSNVMPVAVRINQTPVANAGADRTVCEGTVTRLGATAVTGVSYLWSPTINLSSSTAANPNATVGADITYTLTARLTAAPECFSTDNVNIIASPAPAQFSLLGGGHYCRGDAYRNTRVVVSNSQNDVTYTLLRNGVAVGAQKTGNDGDSLVWHDLEAGTYTVRAANSLGCQQMMPGAIVVSEVPVPTGSIVINPFVVCYGDSATISIRLVGVPPFSVTYKNPFDEYFTVNNINAYLYTIKILPMAGGQWQITEIEDANLCRNIYDLALRPTAELQVGEIRSTGITSSKLNNTVCEGDSVTLSIDALDANGKTLEYLWSTGENVPSIVVAPNATSIYTVIIHDILGCSYQDSIEIKVNPLPKPSFYGVPPLTAQMCQNQGPTQLYGVPTGGSFSGPSIIGYSTYNPINTTGLDSITYTYVDLNGCKNDTVQYFYVNPVPTVDWYVPEELGAPTKYEKEYFFCRFHNDSIPLQGIPRSNSNTIWRINNSLGFSNAELIRTINGAAYIKDALPGIYDVTYVYKDNKGCTDSLTKRIHVSEDYRDSIDMGSISIFGHGDTICRRETNVLFASEMTGVTFRTNDPRLIISQNPTTGECYINPSKVNPGKYRIMAFLTDGKDCDGYNHYSYKDFWIQNPTTIRPLTIPKGYCASHPPVQFHFSSARPVTGFVTLVKGTSDTIYNHIPSNVPATADLTFNPAWGAGKYKIIYEYNDHYCDNVFTDTFRVYPLPTIDMNLYKRDYCYGDIVTLNSKPIGGIYSAGADSLALNANLFATEKSGTGAFFITYQFEDGNGCINSDSVEIFVHGQEKGDMKILGLDSIYCENSGTVEISGFPFAGDSIVPSFQNTHFLTDLGAGRAMIDLSKTTFNSTNTVTYFVKEYYTDVHNNLDSCIHSVSKVFKVLSQSVDFYGYHEGDTICGFLDSLSLIGSKTVNSWFEINTVTGTEVFNRGGGRGTLYPNRLPEGWYKITYHYNHTINGVQYCEVTAAKSFYILPVAPIAPRLVCSADNHNSFIIENSVVGLEYELWTNGTLFSKIAGNGGTITFPPILTEAICAFYINRNQCRTEHPERYRVRPLTISINKDANVSCFNKNDGILTATVKGGNTPTSVQWSAALGTFSSTDLTIRNLTPDTYTVTVSDSIGCTATASASITQPPLLNLTLNNQSGLLCYGSRNGFARVTASGGTLPYTYRWLNESNAVVSTSGNLTNVPAGTYRAFVTDKNGCEETLTIYITQSTKIILQVDNLVNVAIYGQATGEIDINVTGGETPYTYEWAGLGINPADKNNEDQTGLIAGTYFIHIIDDNGCTLDTSLIVTQPEKLTVTAVVRDETCYQSGDGSIDLMVSKGQSPYTFDWTKDGNPFATTEDIYTLGKGIYSVIVTDNVGDIYTNTYEVKSPDSLYIIAKGLTDTAILCYNGANAKLEVEARGGTPAYVYEWSGVGVKPADIHKTTLSGIPAGTYRMKVTDTHNCIVTKDFEITQPADLDITPVSTPPTCYNSTDAAINTTVVGGTAPYTYYWEGAGVLPYSQNQSNIGFGTYKLTVTDANGCTKTATVIINNPIELKIGISTTTPHVCEGSDAEIRFAMNESRNWTIDYTDGANTYTINPTAAAATELHAITQTTTFGIMQAHDQDGCLATITDKDVLVTLHGYPDAALLTNSTDICAGETAQIPFSLSGESPWKVIFREGAYLYEKSGLTMGFDTLLVSPATTRTYELISVSSDYCSTSKSEFVTVNVHPLTVLAASASKMTICNGESTDIQLLLTGEAPFNVYYKEGNTDRVLTVTASPYTLTVSPTVTTRYYFYKVQSGYGCENTVFSDITITVNQLPGQAAAITGLGEVCAGTSTSYFIPLIPSATFYEWILPTGAMITAGAGTNTIMVNYSAGAQTGLIQVRAVNACGNGDYTTKAVDVISRAGAASQIIAPDTVCPLQHGVSISTPAIDNATEYIWRVPPGFIIESGQGTAAIQVSLLAGAVTGDIEVYGRNMCNNGASVSKRIVVNAMPTVEAGADLYTNCKDYITLNAVPLPAPYAGTWRLLQGNGAIADTHNPKTSVTGLGLGTNLFAWEVSNNICVTADTARVINNSADKAVTEADTIILCKVTETMLRAKVPFIGTGKWELVGGRGTIVSPTNNETLVTGIGDGHNMFHWTTAGVDGTCTDFTTVHIFVNDLKPYTNAGQDDTTAVNTWTLNAAVLPSGYTGEWTVVGGTGIIDNPTNHRTLVTNLSSGVNTFRWTVKNGICEDYDEVKIYVTKKTIAEFRLDTVSGCVPLTVKVENVKRGVAQYYWDFGDGAVLDNIEDPQPHTYVKDGVYTITLTAVGSEETDVYTQTLTVFPSPEAKFKILKDTLFFPNTTLLVREESTLLGSIAKWHWQFDAQGTYTSNDRHPDFAYPYPGNYEVSLRVENNYGCLSNMATGMVYVREKCCFIAFPNAFTPNKGRSNGGEYSLETRNIDVLYPVWADVAEYALEVFNRWGEKVFASTDVNVGWDGYVAGRLAPMGVYVYRANGKFANGKSFSKKGEITLIQ